MTTTTQGLTSPQPTTFSVSYRFTESGRGEGLGDLTERQTLQVVRNLDRLGDRVCDVQVFNAAVDVTTDFLVGA